MTRAQITLPNFARNFIETSELDKTLLVQLFVEAADAIGVPPEELPPSVPPKPASKIIGVAPPTLSIWRSTGRKKLPYSKSSRLITYRTVSLIEHKARSIIKHTGEAA